MADIEKDESGAQFVVVDGERKYLTDTPPVNHGPFTDDEGEYFLDLDGKRYIPPVVEPPLFYTCEHGSSNTPDLCNLLAHPTAQTMPDDWYLDPAAPFAYASPEVQKKIALAGGMSDSVKIG